MNKYQLTNIKEKITNIRSLIFYLLIVICSFSCSSPFDTQTSPQELPQGFGSFSLRVESARTILPNPAMDDFVAYTLAFTATSGGTSKIVDRTNADLTSAVTLAVGTYDLEVSAYLDPGKTRLAARGTLTGIVIGSGAQVSGSVTLKPLALGTGSGTFSWNITINASGVTNASMAITPTVSGSPVTLLKSGASTGSLNLASGKYNVTITLTKDGEEAVWDELLYVYPELTSDFTFEFDDNFFYITRYTVTFDYDNGDADGTQTVIHGGTLADPASAATWPLRAGLYPDPLPAHLTIEGWYRDGSTTKWNFTNDIVTGNLTLYAKWSPIIDLSAQSGSNDVAKAVTYVNANAGEYTLLVGGNVSISSQNLTLNSNANLTIRSVPGGSYTITRGFEDANGDGLFIVENGAKLIFENITLDGKKDSFPANAASLVCVNSGGTFTMETGAVLQNNHAEYGGGVWVVGGGTFTMSGGTVGGTGTNDANTAANGGGVYVASNGTFTMTGGTISGNTASGVYDGMSDMNGGGGGVFVSSSGTFTMQGSARVSGNTADSSGGGGVYVEDGTFTMEDNAVVSGNNANNGGGVYVTKEGTSTTTGTFTMTGGTIGGTNTASFQGGGVYVSDGNFTMSGTANISGNTAGEYGGGGVHVQFGSFTMSGGTISGNTASGGYATPGGGVNVGDEAIFTMSGGNISGNTATNGGGVCYAYGTLTLGGTAVIKDNYKDTPTDKNNVYLSSGRYITLAAAPNAPTNGMGVWVQTATTNGVIVNSGAASGNESYFHADDADKAVILQGNQLLLAWNVKNVADLQKVGTGTDGRTLSAYYLQTADITLSGNWQKIGSSATASFTGTYNGGGHTITNLNLTFNSANASRNGMFGYIGTGGVVENLGLVNVNITLPASDNYGWVGGIAGENSGTIQNCSVSGIVSGAGNTQSGIFGGIAGSNYQGTIQNCSFSGIVEAGTDQAGGIAGDNNGGTIQNCFVSGSVKASTNQAGGIVGRNNTGTLLNCVALNESVTLSGASADIGRISGTSTGTLQNNYAWKDMTLANGGGLVSASPSDTGKNGADVTAANAKTQAAWETADFSFATSSSWQWNANGMPSLRGVGTAQAWPEYLEDPFNVANESQWAAAVLAIKEGLLTSYKINVTGNFNINGYSSNTFGTRTGITVAINGDSTITLTPTEPGIWLSDRNLLYIGNNQTVTMIGLTLKGIEDNQRALVCINGGTFNMESGMITGNINGQPDTFHGGGVYVKGGTFNMNGGTISGNEAYGAADPDAAAGGGGVFVDTGGTFNMLGGTISGNKAMGVGVNGGGVYVGNNGTFRISNGTVYGNDGYANSNTAPGGTGAALYKDNDGTAQYGTFGSTWYPLNTTNTTIVVENGEIR